MTDIRKAAQTVLYLKKDDYPSDGGEWSDKALNAYEALRQALAEPVEPVASCQGLLDSSRPSIDALIDVLAETPFRKTLGDSQWQATFTDQQLDIISNAIRARGQK